MRSSWKSISRNAERSALLQIAPQQKRAIIWKCFNFLRLADVPAAELDAILNVRIALASDERCKGLRMVVRCLDFDRNQRRVVADKEIFFERGVFFLVVKKLISALHQRLADKIFVKRPLRDAEVAVRAKVFLHFVIERRDEETGIGIVELILRRIVIPLERELRRLECMADVLDARIRQPFTAAKIIFETRALRDF